MLRRNPLRPFLADLIDPSSPQGTAAHQGLRTVNGVGCRRDRGGSGYGSAMAMDGKLRRSLLSDRLELRLLLVAQRSIEALERGAHQMDRALHSFEPPLHCVKRSGG